MPFFEARLADSNHIIMDKNSIRFLNYPYLSDHDISHEEMANAADTLAAYMIQNCYHTVACDLYERNKTKKDALRREMTIEEIEKELGYLIKIKGND